MSIPPTLLLADDSLAIQRVVALTFADQPIRVVVAKDGQDAINRMSSEPPDLVLADTNMPCVDGYELARWVRQHPHLNRVPVLLLAGISDPVDEQRLHDSGANGVLEKPFEPTHVISRVKELLGIKGTPPATATRLLSTPDPKPTPPPAPKSKSSPSRPVAGAVERGEPTPPPSVTHEPAPKPPIELPTAVGAEGRAPLVEAVPSLNPVTAAASTDFEILGGARGDARDWFGEETAAPPSPAPSLADQLGVSDARFYGQGDEVARSRGLDHDFAPPASSGMFGAPPASRIERETATTADVFQSLLAAEEDPSRAVTIRAVAPEMSAEMLEQLAARVVDGLRPVAPAVRDGVAAEARAAVAEAVQSAVNGTILGTLRGAVNEAVQSTLPATVEHQVAVSLAPALRDAVAREMHEAILPAIQQLVRELVEPAVRHAVSDAVAAAVPAAVLDAVRGESGGQVQQVVRETAERLITEEIARIRERRPS